MRVREQKKGGIVFMRKAFTWKKTHIVGFLFCIGVFLKQFYLSSSGSVQIADMVIATSVFAGLVMGLFRIYKADLRRIRLFAWKDAVQPAFLGGKKHRLQ